MKTNYITIIIIAFIVISMLLSLIGVISASFSQILTYSVMIIGIYFVYSEISDGNIFLVFLGSVIFLAGIYYLVVNYFDLQIMNGIIAPIILIFAGSGLLIVYITSRLKKFILLISVILLSVGITLIIAKSHFKFGSFIQSVIPVFNFLWPVILIAALIIFMVRKKQSIE
jgi:hypothetical protein